MKADADDFTVERAGVEEKDFLEVFALLVALHREGGYAPMEPDDAIADVYDTLKEGMTFLARAADGQPIGVLGLTEVRFWFNRKVTFLDGRWFYVIPAERGGQVGVKLLRAARDEGQARNMITFVSTTNPDRRQKRNQMSLQAQTAGFIPVGYAIKLN
jgi:GNAT superfamily N-acetyltransferase